MSTTTATATLQGHSQAEYDALVARVRELENKGKAVKRTEKGSLSMYGLSSKFPVTLTFTQWMIVKAKLAQVEAVAREQFASLYFANEEQKANAKKILGIS